MRSRIPFHAGLLCRVSDFECGTELWQTEVAEWIKAPADCDGALQSMNSYGTSVWVYESESGELVAYNSLGETSWVFSVNDTITSRVVQAIPYLGVKSTSQGNGYGRRILEDVMAEAEYRSLRKNAPPILALVVHPENHAALNLYDKIGFRREGFEDGYVRMYVDIGPHDAVWNTPGSPEVADD
jgi:ribosomal protein S18 acetylase RimI-like enzyme